MMLKKWIVLLLSTAFVLAACHSPVYNQTEGNIADVKIKAAKERVISDNKAKPLPPLLIKKGLYVDTTPISLSKRPSWLNNHIVVRGDQLPFSYYSRVIAAGAGSKVLTKYQVGMDPTSNVSINYSGTIRGALDMLAAKSGYVYSINNNMIYWQAFITRTFDIAFMPGDSDYLLGKKSSGGGANTAEQGTTAQVSNYTTSDSSDSEYSNLSGKVSIWKDLQATIAQMLSADGKVTVSQASTSVTVRDRPTNVQLVGQYIYNLNSNLSKQVLVKVQVLEVSLENAYNYGIDWAIITNAFHNSPFTLNANYGTPIAITALNTASGASTTGVPTLGTVATVPEGKNPIPSYTILLKALNQQGKTSVVSEPRVLCLNNQVSVVRIVKSEGYVASIQNTATPGVSSTTNTVTSQVTPGMLVTGLTLYILPKILNDRIYLSVNADLSTNDGFKQFGPTNSEIQLPSITEKHFNQRSMVKSGDTLILSGFRQVTNRTGANQFLTSQALGGKAAEQVNTETVVLITPILLHGSA
ncbi:Outer membrane lipoprotein BfpB [Aquicella siphonis]|uniref:Outer membrane lipoprotein BfpB n=1 Tax=Aquicella siphonis TaxID=254247 RepID=A0A5E4PJZ3_9COXI|nr:secretin N-terminal domain-containing protein [Aquicella siphonis]VVC76885.1 Outer membrane lipoprotein BfpB [Aquicella siphonis]